MDRYKWKYRLLILVTPSRKNKDYLRSTEIYQQNIKSFHRKHVKLTTQVKKNSKFQVQLVGFDGTLKKTYPKLNPKKVFGDISEMPMGDWSPLESNLSLYSDYDENKTIKGLGFKNLEKALHTIDRIKDEPLQYQISVVNTMLGRAKHHPHQTKGMRDAIKVFQSWHDLR